MEQREEGGDPACWADEFTEYLGLEDDAQTSEPFAAAAPADLDPGTVGDRP